ncbi:MAG TPA: hypothetical protein PLQ82_03745 [Desulfobacteraceae bacterium]|jgi:hypothetical protein|nr:MAG: hypothetical protein BWX96_02362 [Bacteroidetes bacterium ADurb.Bin145]HPQ27566.1 hypothetical protein [Desulfobacteraceae bacterium]
MEFLSTVKRDVSNLPGWRTKERLIVFESDDWGSIRMPSKEAFENLAKSGIDLFSDEGNRFNKYDSLATVQDLASLFGVLESVKDKTDRPAVFTPFALVANPDFRKIQDLNFTEFHYEPFTKTLQRYPGCEKSFDLWKDGISHRLFVPQFHGREHLNVRVWLKALQKGNKKILTAFENNMWGISTAGDPGVGTELQAAFDVLDKEDLLYQSTVISSGLRLFSELFGYKSLCFVPPNGPFNSALESVCYNEGIRYISTPKIHLEPLPGGRKVTRLRWLGKKSSSGITYLTRNCYFEPGQPGKDWVGSCLSDISAAFRWRKPAIISSHRVNYIGAIHLSNRTNGLSQLQRLLKGILRNWPDARFVTSAELGELINRKTDV